MQVTQALVNMPHFGSVKLSPDISQKIQVLEQSKEGSVQISVGAAGLAMFHAGPCSHQQANKASIKCHPNKKQITEEFLAPQ